MKTINTLAVCIFALTTTISALRADTFGSGPNTFTIDFVSVGNAGNAADTEAGGGNHFSPHGGVAYTYRMGVTEVPQDWIDKATNLGLANVNAGPWTGMRPATNMTWYEAAAFVNLLNTDTGHQAAYDLTWTGVEWTMNLWSNSQAWQAGGENLYRHKDAYYFLPSENEWYKAAYHKNDGVTANYWDYPTSNNSIPDGLDFSGDPAFDAVFYDGYDDSQPNSVANVGVASPYGTFGQGGNVLEWVESAFDGTNDSSSELRPYIGGTWLNTEDGLRSNNRLSNFPSDTRFDAGFRVASVPELTTAATLVLGLGLLLSRRTRRRVCQ